MVQSGRTKRMSDELERMYNREYEHNQNYDWLWGYNEDALKELLDRPAVPFKDFFVRYLLGVHETEMKEMAAKQGLSGENEQLADKIADMIIKEAQLKKVLFYDNTTENVRWLADLVYEDFGDNGLGFEKKDIHQRYWDKTQLLRKIMADSISDDDLWTFGFGLNIDCDDLSFFLRKVLRRTDFNLWNETEFLLFLTFRYAPGERYEFFRSLQKAYHSVAPRDGGWMKTMKAEGASTVFIQDRTKALIKKLKDNNVVFVMDQEGKWTGEVLDFLAYYKNLNKQSGEYVRTIAEEAERLREKLEENVKEDIKSQAGTDKEDNQTVVNAAVGYVTLYYRPEKGIHIPAGTEFFKTDKKTGRKIGFRAESEVKIEPADSFVKQVEINVICEKSGKKKKEEEKTTGYMPANTKLRCTNYDGLFELANKSKWKSPNSVAVGEETCIEGKIYGKCSSGELIEQILIFEADSEETKKVTYKSVGTVDGRACVDVFVSGLNGGEEALKNEITDCGICGWQALFSMTNTKIGVNKKKKEQKASGGRLYNYLYPGKDEAQFTEDSVLDAGYRSKLNMLLKGVRMSSSKLSEIKNRKSQNITRNDILTLSFLAYTSGIKKKQDYLTMTEKTFRAIRLGFMQEANDVLQKCGFYELYAPNFYDSLLVLLLSSEESFDAYRNLVGLYTQGAETIGEK